MAVVFVPNEAGIQSLTAPGGHVYRFIQRMGRNTRTLAKRHAPVGQGTLRAGIRGPDMAFYPRAVTARVHSTARHSLWVHEGTHGPIRRPSGGVMPIRNVHARAHVLAYARVVKGQRPQPFLRRGLREAFLIGMSGG